MIITRGFPQNKSGIGKGNNSYLTKSKKLETRIGERDQKFDGWKRYCPLATGRRTSTLVSIGVLADRNIVNI
jgi:hypothetical protein